MKSKITLLIAVFFITLSNAQTKVGTVNSELIIGKMPQMQDVLKRVDNYAKQLDSSFQIKIKEYQSKIDAYKIVEKTLTNADKETKYQEISNLEKEITTFRKNGGQMIKLRRDQYIRPLYKKVSSLISEIAKNQGYTQILTTSGNEFGYIDERFDITQLILNKLGIK